jgi:hypothetical protein
VMLSANKVLIMAASSKPVTRSWVSLFAVDPLRLHHSKTPPQAEGKHRWCRQFC